MQSSLQTVVRLQQIFQSARKTIFFLHLGFLPSSRFLFSFFTESRAPKEMSGPLSANKASCKRLNLDNQACRTGITKDVKKPFQRLGPNEDLRLTNAKPTLLHTIQTIVCMIMTRTIMRGRVQNKQLTRRCFQQAVVVDSSSSDPVACLELIYALWCFRAYQVMPKRILQQIVCDP